ncbi:hypothetical protein FH972_022655 [Carpinus fangiana]|uniref:AB hydrolase-1 domain-containing protein n=1 Tax=Carpinus fangiana TaxID=176857 RepID=A0A5N6KTF3_9ROSI|nr:hypothetical protein FH972_022655 [Carpinus fangiana]
MSTSKPTILLVPGAWHTSAVYTPLQQELDPFLEGSIHTIDFPSLQRGDFANESHPPRSLFPDDVAHIRDTLKRHVEESKREVIVVMNSYGSIPTQNALRGLSKRERSANGDQGGVVALLYIASRPLGFGESMASTGMAPSMSRDKPENFEYVDPPPSAHSLFYSDLEDAEALGCASQLQPQSNSVFQGVADHKPWDLIPSFYLVCKRDVCIPSGTQELWAKQCGMTVMKVDAGHVPFMSSPAAVADMVRSINSLDMENVPPRMGFDDVAWEKSEEDFKTWSQRYLRDEPTMYAIGHLITKHRLGTPELLERIPAGAYNLVYRMKFLDGGSAIARFPKPGQVKFPEEKVRNEVATMRFIQEHTTIPVPFVLHYGMSDESPDGLGPFIIMEWIESSTSLYDLLRLPNLPDKERPVINPDIPLERIEYIYSQLADILLQLSRLKLPKIGSLRQIDEETWKVDQRPLSQQMNALIELGSFPSHELLNTTSDSTQAYYCGLSEQMMHHFITQPHYCFRTTTEGQFRFMARWLFRKLANEGRLPSQDGTEGNNFPLFFDDMRPSNILLSKNDRIVGLIDWEFVYAAPPSFTNSPPWWLMMDEPEYWPADRTAWPELYERQLVIFLRCLKAKEDEKSVKEAERLSTAMRQSWDTGDFWIDYMVRRPWAFDTIYWREIDKRFFDVKEGASLDDVLDARKELAGDQVREKMRDCILDKVDHHNRMHDDRTTCCFDWEKIDIDV